MLPRAPSVLPHAPPVISLAPSVLPPKRPCSLSRPGTVIGNSKFGVYIIYIYREPLPVHPLGLHVHPLGET